MFGKEIWGKKKLNFNCIKKKVSAINRGNTDFFSVLKISLFTNIAINNFLNLRLYILKYQGFKEMIFHKFRLLLITLLTAIYFELFYFRMFVL